MQMPKEFRYESMRCPGTSWDSNLLPARAVAESTTLFLPFRYRRFRCFQRFQPMGHKLRLLLIVLSFDVPNVIVGRVMVLRANPLYDVAITVKCYNVMRIADITVLCALTCVHRIKALPFISHEYRRNVRLCVSWIYAYVRVCIYAYMYTYVYAHAPTHAHVHR